MVKKIIFCFTMCFLTLFMTAGNVQAKGVLTGDNSTSIFVYIVLAVVTIAGIVLLLKNNKKK